MLLDTKRANKSHYFNGLNKKELGKVDLIMTGEASRLAGCDRRTFKKHADKLKIKPIGNVEGGKAVYRRKDADKVIHAYKAFIAQKLADK